MAGVRRQRRRADAPGIFVFDVRAGGDQQPRRRQIADARGEHQRGVAALRDRAVVVRIPMRRHRHHFVPDLRPRVDVGAVRDERLHHVGMLLGSGPHQRGLTARAARVQVRARISEYFPQRGQRLSAAEGQRQRLCQRAHLGVRALAQFRFDRPPAFRHWHLTPAFERRAQSTQDIKLHLRVAGVAKDLDERGQRTSFRAFLRAAHGNDGKQQRKLHLLD